MQYRYEMASTIEGVSVEDVWDRVNTWEGVNYELGPLVKMSVPSKYPRVSDVPADGQCHFASKILLLGILPIDSHNFALRAIDPPNYFDERSENRMMRLWTHKRTVTTVGKGVLVTDHCGFEPRLAFLGRMLFWVYNRVFRARHQRLTRFFSPSGST